MVDNVIQDIGYSKDNAKAILKTWRNVISEKQTPGMAEAYLVFVDALQKYDYFFLSTGCKTPDEM